jgi:S1-C subfamily serine protease
MGSPRALKSGLLALLVLLPAAARADRKPLKVDADELHPITFSRLILRLEREDDIGVGKAEFRVRFLEEMRRLGYPAVGAESLIFDKDNSGQARFLLGGTVTELVCNIVGGFRPYRLCGVAVLWEVMDSDLDRVVYKVVTKHEMGGTVYQDPALARDLVMGAFRSLLSRPRFVDVLRRRPEPTAGKRYASAHYRACRPPAISMPRGAELVLRASVVVESEGGHGSGVLISPDGLVLTAAHVVRSTPALKVRLQDGTRLDASVVRIDADADVALLRLQKSGTTNCLVLRHAPVATGEEVYAVGAPLDRSLAFSLTRGIVSGTREVRGATLLQTDASVNAGNSGGPLVDDIGRAVAIVRSKVVGTGVEGVAFGVPAPVATERLAIAPGEATDAVLFQAAPKQPEPVVFEDVADDLHPPPVVAATRAPAQSVAARPQRRVDPDATDWLRWRRVGYVAGGIGLATVLGTEIVYLKTQNDLTQSRFDILRTANDVGWVLAGAGTALVITSFVLYEASDARVAATVGPTSVSLAGRF